MTKLDWEINIENLAARVAETYGAEVTASIFSSYGASGFNNLNPAYYDRIFGDLMQMDADR